MFGWSSARSTAQACQAPAFWVDAAIAAAGQARRVFSRPPAAVPAERAGRALRWKRGPRPSAHPAAATSVAARCSSAKRSSARFPCTSAFRRPRPAAPRVRKDAVSTHRPTVRRRCVTTEATLPRCLQSWEPRTSNSPIYEARMTSAGRRSVLRRPVFSVVGANHGRVVGALRRVVHCVGENSAVPPTGSRPEMDVAFFCADRLASTKRGWTHCVAITNFPDSLVFLPGPRSPRKWGVALEGGRASGRCLGCWRRVGRL